MNEPKHKRVQSSLATQNLRIARLHKALTQNKADRRRKDLWILRNHRNCTVHSSGEELHAGNPFNKARSLSRPM